MRKLFALVIGLTVFLLVGIKISAAAPICLDPKGHLVWPSPQSASTIPMRSANTADTLTNSPLSVNGGTVGINSNLGVSGNVSATGNVTGANLCLGINCVNNWSQVSGPWTQAGNNLHPTNNAWNVGIGRTDPSYKLDVNGTFRVTVNGEERLVIKETGAGGPGAHSPNQHNLAQVKPAYAQTTTDRWMELFGGAAYFLKRGTNSDVFLQVGNKDTNVSSIKAKGRTPTFALRNQSDQLVGQIWYYPQNDSITIQYLKGWTDQNQSVPITELNISQSGLKIFKGDTPNTQKLIYEITEE